MPCNRQELLASRHPCYSAESQHKYARMHVPVAPACNIQCNYCNRLYDCVNESRPGVTSEILAPDQVLAKIAAVRSSLDNLAVIGIAGPGDALANWEQTRQTLMEVRRHHPDLIPCLSTNGLMLPHYAQEIVDLGVRHATVTVNSVDPVLSEKIYAHIEWGGKRLHGRSAMQRLLDNQLTGIRLLAGRGVLIKVNIVMIPGVNEDQIPEVVKAVKAAGASLTNIMPLIPAVGSAFAHLLQTSHREVAAMRERCEAYLPQMRHCQQCRADAIGLLTQDRSAEFRDLPVCSGDRRQDGEVSPITDCMGMKFRVAVTSKTETLVDQHFGHAEHFLIYVTDGKNNTLLERRSVVKYCSGNDYCESAPEFKQETVNRLADCNAVVTMRIGAAARERLMMRGILVVEACNDISAGLKSAVQELVLTRVG